MSETVRRRILVAGRVQGVGYRAACHTVATASGLGGYVRNRDDGRVEVVAVGLPASVDRLVEWCGIGPRGARVEHLEVASEPVGAEDSVGGGFRIFG